MRFRRLVHHDFSCLSPAISSASVPGVTECPGNMGWAVVLLPLSMPPANSHIIRTCACPLVTFKKQRRFAGVFPGYQKTISTRTYSSKPHIEYEYTGIIICR